MGDPRSSSRFGHSFWSRMAPSYAITLAAACALAGCGGQIREEPCFAESNEELCAGASAACGGVTAKDRCGVVRTVASCGACAEGSACNVNRCEMLPETDAAFCARLGATCGALSATDNVGAARSVATCGTCTGEDLCKKNGCVPPPMPFEVGGRVTYDHVPARDGVTEGGVRLDYAGMSEKPVRRAVVQAIDATSGAIVTTGSTNDDGVYKLALPAGASVKVRVLARSTATNYAADGVGPEACRGAAWDVRVVDNTSRQALYAVDSAGAFDGATASADLRARVVFGGSAYTDRSGAPFAMLDTVLRAFELVCDGKPDANLPPLLVNWSVRNTNTSGSLSSGAIGTSFYSGGATTKQLYILGKEDVDTDEFDDHVIAHECGHYVEDALYRSDALGGSHTSEDSLDARVAFGEGWGNALSGMVTNDPIYVDTTGAAQGDGFDFGVDTAPEGDDRGIYSEASVQYLLWHAYEARDRAAQSGRFDRLHAVLAQHRSTAAFTSVHAFAALYNASFGDADIRTSWATGLASPLDALCVGACTGSGDAADLFDTDNDLGLAYGAAASAGGRRYPQGDAGSSFSPEWWRLYVPLTRGVPLSGQHERIDTGGYDEPDNKYGSTRWYRFVGDGQPATIAVSNLVGGATCTQDVLDLIVFKDGARVVADEAGRGATAGCPRVALQTTTPGASYLVDLRGLGVDVAGFTLSLP